MSFSAFPAPRRGASPLRAPHAPHTPLAIYVPPPTQQITTSKFSPESPPPSPPLPPRPRGSLFSSGRRSSSRNRERERDVEAQAQASNTSVPIFQQFHHYQTSSLSMPATHEPATNSDHGHEHSQSHSQNRLSKWWFHARTLGHHREPLVLPMQRPLYLSEKGPATTQPAKQRSNWRSRMGIAILILVLLFLLGNVVILDIKLAALERPTIISSSPSKGNGNNGTTTDSPTSSSSLTSAQQQCLTQFTINAVAAPASYPSSECAGILASVSSDALSSSSEEVARQVGQALDFSGLKGIFDSASKSAQTALYGAGWMVDTRVCTWRDVQCDGAGRVVSVKLTAPAIPQSLPTELGALTALQTLSVIGDNTLPGGNFPTTFTALTKLTNLHIEATGLSNLPDDLFKSLASVTAFELVNNDKMTGVPSSLPSLSLGSLLVNGQPAPSLSPLLSSPTLQKSLQILDLSRSPVPSGTLPSNLADLASLTELHLPNANIGGPFPSSVPQGLVVLDVTGNSNLEGELPQSLCGSQTIKTCDFRGTAFGGSAAPGSCGPCLF